jgi:hypothetical protein
MKKWLVALAATSLLAGHIETSRAVGITFAQFVQQNGAQLGFSHTGAAETIIGGNSTITASVPVLLTFSGAPLVGGAVNSVPYMANLTLMATSSAPAELAATSALQTYNTVSFSFIASAANGGVAIGDNLLSGTSGALGEINGGLLSGTINGESATFSGSDVTSGIDLNQVTFTSDFLTFTGLDDSYAYSLTSVDPMYFFNDNGTPGDITDDFIRSFDASGTGTFAAAFVPEPGSVAMLISMGVVGLAFLRRRK